MINENKILWKEGLFLTPQHFQALDRYFESSQAFFLNLITPYNWGVLSINIDEESIGNWEFKINSCEIVFRDGTVLRSPKVDLNPPIRIFQELFADGKSSLLVYLGLHKEDLSYANVQDQQGSKTKTRYAFKIKNIPDYVTGSNPREIETILKNPVILFEGESLDSYDYIPIAKIILQNVGQPNIANDFMPPSLSLNTCPFIKHLVNRLHQEIITVADKMKQSLTYTNADKSLNITLADINNYLKAREFFGFIPFIKEFYSNKKVHPSCLYSSLSIFLSQLYILFNIDDGKSINELLPVYDHNNPQPGFDLFRKKVREVCALAVQSREGEVILSSNDGEIWKGDISTLNLIGNELFFVWIASDIDDETISDLIIKQKEIKLGTPSQLEHLITFGLPGIELMKESHPPALLPAIDKGLYFKINTKDDLWREVISSNKINIIGRKDIFPNLKVRLHFLKK